MQATLAGDQNSYRLLLSNLRPWLIAFFTKRVHPNAIEDLVQDTLMSLHTKRQTYDPRYPFGAWISAIARHRWIDHMRKTLRYVEIEIDENMPSLDITKDQTTVDDLHTLLKLIPSAQANIINMVKIQEMSVEEVSEKTGYSTTNIKVMIHRGMKKMITSVKGEKSD